MVIKPKQRNIAYRCPVCGSSIIGLIGKFTLGAGLVRLKCSCENSPALDINRAGEGKVRLSVPCIFCKQNHNYVISESIFFERELFLLNCPYSGMDIAFIGDMEAIEGELSRTKGELESIMAGLEADELSDIQPQDMTDDEIPPDPAVYDTIRFLVKELEADGKVYCPCKNGRYNLRFTDDGIQVYCENCGASYTFRATTQTMSEEYLEIDSITLK